MRVSRETGARNDSINNLFAFSRIFGLTVMSGSIFSQVSCDGQAKHLYKYVCRGHGHHHGCHFDDNNSCRSIVYSTVDIYPDCSSRSGDSTHEIIKIGYRKCTSSNCSKHRKRDKKGRKVSIVSKPFFSSPLPSFPLSFLLLFQIPLWSSRDV